MKKLIAVASLGVALGVGGTMAAQAATATNTTTTTNTLISAKCYHHHSVGATQFRWDSKANRYVVYASTHNRTSDYNTCHK